MNQQAQETAKSHPNDNGIATTTTTTGGKEKAFTNGGRGVQHNHTNHTNDTDGIRDTEFSTGERDPRSGIDEETLVEAPSEAKNHSRRVATNDRVVAVDDPRSKTPCFHRGVCVFLSACMLFGCVDCRIVW